MELIGMNLKWSSIFNLILLSIVHQSICLEQSNQHLYATKTTYHQAYFKLLNNDNQIKNFKPPDQCKPKMLYMICRHATRYPSKKKITRMQSKIYLFRDLLIENNKISPEQKDQFKKWELKMQLDDDNRITDSGFQETRLLGN